ncbi:auxin-responsive protein SAUR78-like [Vicia villosa]|uniref:auxin-responsive protein SAUR78-like n=1 Tax=Vicia villosa TaxID=3911 RepID=UPI00273CDB5C|nr:auxin-responsive protein SAUR78-like [Vicia villosa]
MVKCANLTKLTSAFKRWPSLTKLSFMSSTSKQKDHEPKLHVVYVGKSRRRYLVNSKVFQHPVFQELVDRSCCEDGVVVVSCEVVLFEHLVWMLESAESDETQLGSMDELVEFYHCGAC